MADIVSVPLSDEHLADSEQPMSEREPTWDLARFRAVYDQDDNEWWRIACGHHLNLFDAACAELDRLRAQVEAVRAARPGGLIVEDRLRAQRDEARAQVEAVRAVADEAMLPGRTQRVGGLVDPRAIVAALDKETNQ